MCMCVCVCSEPSLVKTEFLILHVYGASALEKKKKKLRLITMTNRFAGKNNSRFYSTSSYFFLPHPSGNAKATLIYGLRLKPCVGNAT